MVKSAELILLMLSDLIFGFVYVCVQKQSFEAIFPYHPQNTLSEPGHLCLRAGACI